MMKTLKDFVVLNGLQTGPFGSQLKAEEYEDTGIPVVMPKDISRGFFSETTIARISQEKANILRRHKISYGDILFSRRGDLSKIGIATEENEGWICGTGCLRARLSTELNPKYMLYYSQQQSIKEWLESNALGQTMLNLNTSILGNLPVFAPSLPEQQAIVDVLESWDKAISLTEKLVKAKERTFSYLLHRIILDHQTNSFSKSVQLEDICSITTGSKDVNEGDPEGSYPFFTCGKDHIYSNEFSFDTTAILIAGNGNIGNPQLYTGKFEAYQRTYVLYDFKHVSAQYLLFYLTATLRRQIEKERQQGAMPYIKLSTLAKFMIHFPPIDEQDQLASLLSSLRQEIYLLEQIECKFMSQKQALMQKLLTGEWRVKA